MVLPWLKEPEEGVLRKRSSSSLDVIVLLKWLQPPCATREDISYINRMAESKDRKHLGP